jgi:hypothetical protein
VSKPKEFSEGFVEPAFNRKNFWPAKPTSIVIFEKFLAGADLAKPV